MGEPEIKFGWHFVREGGCLGYGDGRKVEAGETLSVDVAPRLCLSGLHASESISDALTYAPGPIVCRVAVWGDVVGGADKFAGRSRHALWMIDATRVLREHACWCATRALEWAHWQHGTEPDPRSVGAILVAQAFARGEATGEELDAAWDAARAAAWAAARDAAWDAARAAAWAAARDAAWDAARDAAWDDLEYRIADEAHRVGVYVNDYIPEDFSADA